MTLELEQTENGHIHYIWKRLRPKDKQELKLFNMTDETYFKQIKNNATFCYTARFNGKPAALFGGTLHGNTLQLFFFGTEEVNHNFKTIWKGSLMCLDEIAQKYPAQQITVRVWEGYPEAIEWLERMGFVDGKLTIGKKGERLKYMIWKNKITVKANIEEEKALCVA